MSDMSSYVGDALLNWLKATAMVAAPASCRVALFNGDPDSGGSEVTGTVGLTRQTVPWGSVAARALANNAEINFGTASGSATVTYVALFDQGTNQIAKKAITSASITSGEVVTIASAALSASY